MCITKDIRGHLEYRRARLDLGTSKVQYHAAELWNLLSDVIKIVNVENISNVIFVKKIYTDTMDNFHNFDLIGEMPLVARVAKMYYVVNCYQR